MFYMPDGVLPYEAHYVIRVLDFFAGSMSSAVSAYST
jgi:hypothetical protein